MEIGDYRTFVAVIRSLSYCPSLVQLGLTITIANFPLDTKDEVEFTALFVDLVERLPKLIALLVVLPGASQSNCIAATSILVSKFGNFVRLVLVFAPKLLTVSTATICPSFYLPITRPWLKISFRWLAFYRTI